MENTKYLYNICVHIPSTWVLMKEKVKLIYEWGMSE